VISSMLLSVVVALVLTPVLCASLLKPVAKGHEAAETGNRLLRPFFMAFDRLFYRLRDSYLWVVRRVLGARFASLTAFALIVVLMGYLFVRMPTAYLPEEDQGMLMAMIQLPAGSTLEQTDAVVDKFRQHFLEHEKEAVESVMCISGFSMAGRGQNQAMAFVKLKDWELRDRPELRVKAIVGRAMMEFSGYRNALAFAFAPPAVPELGTSAGFDFELQDRGGLGHEKLMQARLQLLMMAAQDPRLVRVRPNGLDDVPEYHSDVDWEKAGTLGVPISSIHQAISAAFGSAYVNDFIQGGRVKRVYVQADAQHRMLPSDLDRLYVRNSQGGMARLSELTSGRWVYDSPRLERYNSFPSLNFLGEPAPGRSSGEAMQAMEEIVAKLPQGIGYDWTGLSYQERMGQAQTGLLYSFSILAIFLVLAALYESWSVPIAILLCLPLGVIGGVLASSGRELPNDVYFQIGLLTVLGLTTKNAILIVQFAKIRLESGEGLIQATLEAAKLRLRPIVMTSMAFGFGVLPLAIAKGAGAGAQQAIGTSVLGGMLSGTFLAVVFIPLFYVVVMRIFGTKDKPGSQRSGSGETTPAEGN